MTSSFPAFLNWPTPCIGNGCELIAQIFQNGAAIKTKGGAWCSSTLTADELPSPEPYATPTARPFSLEEIEAFQRSLLRSGRRAKERAGLDGIEVHAGETATSC